MSARELRLMQSAVWWRIRSDHTVSDITRSVVAVFVKQIEMETKVKVIDQDVNAVYSYIKARRLKEG